MNHRLNKGWIKEFLSLKKIILKKIYRMLNFNIDFTEHVNQLMRYRTCLNFEKQNIPTFSPKRNNS